MNANNDSTRSRHTAAMTAMLDLLACLLLWFLAGDPDFLAKPLRLPRWDGPAGRRPTEKDQPHRVVISGPGEISWDGSACPLDDLPARFEAAAHSDETVQLYMDRDAPFDAFWSVYNTYWKCGFARPPSLVVHRDNAKVVAQRTGRDADLQ